MKYKRSLLKLSGEALMGNNEFGLHSTRLQQYAEEVKKVVDMGAQVAIVIGGGNIFRGFSRIKEKIINRIEGDYMGMLATVINGIAFQSYLENVGICAYIQTAIRMDQIAEPFGKDRAIHHLEKGRVVIFVAGLGNPYFTTDTAAVLRAIEIKADVLLKGTRVDGIYTKDPEKDKYAKKLKNISFDMVYQMGIKVMDQTAFILGNENNLPIIIFDINRKGNFQKLISGEEIGTLVSKKKIKIMDELNDIFFSCKKDMEKIVKQLKEEIHRIRLGSKSIVSLLEKIKIKCYGSTFLLIEVANITIVDNMNITIHPWDRSTVTHIDKAIIDANLGFMPTNKGESIHIHLPIITEEGRKNFLKKIKLQTENAKVLIRNVRKKNNQNIRKLKISEDFSKSGENRIQKITSEYIQKIEDFFLYKEKEILRI